MKDIKEEIKKDGLRIVKLEFKNFKKLRAFEIEPKTNLVKIKGKNGAGKSTVIDAIWAAIGGKSASPDQPITGGERQGKVTLDLGPIIVEKSWSTKSGESLTIKNRDGETIKKPQTLLDEFIGKTTIDPGSFLTLENKKQAEVLKNVLGIDFEELDKEKAKAYNERTEFNKDAKRLRAHADSIEGDPDGPKEEETTTSVLEELEKANKETVENDTARNSLAAIKEAHGQLEVEIGDLEHRLKKIRYEKELLAKGIEDDKEAVSKLVDPDTEEIKTKLAGLEETNKKARNNAAKDKALKDALEAENKAEKLDEQIKDIDEKKAASIREAKFPVDGLAFGEDGLELNGVPFAQASQAERLTAAFAIACRANPHLKILAIKDGSLFDSDSLAKLKALAEKEGVMLLLEIVTDSGDGSLEIVEE